MKSKLKNCNQNSLIKNSYWICFLFLFIFIQCNNERKEAQGHEGHGHEGSNLNSSKNNSNESSNKEYICPMHPYIVKDKPGACPICGMDLVEKIENINRKKLNLGSVIEPVNQTVLSSVRTIKPQEKAIDRVVESLGYISYNPANASSISSLYSGRVDKLYIKYNYQDVKKGQKILEIYSPEILTAQDNLIFLLKNDSTASSLIESNKQRLRLLGMSDDQIKNLIKSKKVSTLLTVYSPVSGHIHQMNSISEITMPVMEMKNSGSPMNTSSATDEMSIKEGDYIQKGQTLFTIINTNKLWAILPIFPEDVSRIKVGQRVDLVTEKGNGLVSGKINFIEPVYESGSKNTNVRVYIENNNHHDLPVGSLIKGKIATGTQSGLWIPGTAVVQLGDGTNVVFLKSDNTFTTHLVTIGAKVGDEIELIEGIAVNDEIAINAQYLVDSESFVKLVK
jgi:Cu(I)/Ag(I) efflux system membrane fusion protein